MTAALRGGASRAAPPGAASDGRRADGSNVGAMAISLVLAVGLWFTFGLRETYVVTVPVELRVVGVPAGQALRAAPPAAARATFRGEGWRLMLLARSTPVVPIDADAAAVDLERAVLASGLSANLTLQGVRPKTARLSLERLARRRVPVRLVSDIRTAPSYGLLRPPRLLPDSVEVTGAASLVEGLTSWPTVRLVLDGLQAPTTRTVALADPFGGLLMPSVRSTTVQVPIA
ncbi:MAG TPA: YbbR-like domain-containing protein, partial [Rubricoccaceae bacterium]